MFQGIFDILLYVLIEKSKALLIILSMGIIKKTHDAQKQMFFITIFCFLFFFHF